MRGPWGDRPGQGAHVDAYGNIIYGNMPGWDIQNGSAVRVPGAGNPAWENARLANGGVAPGLTIANGSVVKLPPGFRDPISGAVGTGSVAKDPVDPNSAEFRTAFNSNDRATKFGEAPTTRQAPITDAYSSGMSPIDTRRASDFGVPESGRLPGDTPGERFNAASEIFSRGGPATSGQGTPGDKFGVASFNFSHGGPAISGQNTAADKFNEDAYRRSQLPPPPPPPNYYY